MLKKYPQQTYTNVGVVRNELACLSPTEATFQLFVGKNIHREYLRPKVQAYLYSSIQAIFA